MAIIFIVVIVLDYIVKNRVIANKCCKRILLYYAAMIVITLLIRMSFLDGLQKMFAELNIGNLSLNGRGFIWEKAIESFLKSPIWGYGVHGTLIQVFWSKWNDDGSGMNYMHNQLLQVANDGGLILLVLYVLMIYTVMDSIDKIPNKRIQKRCGGFMLAVLVVMSFESGLEYVYLLMVLILLSEIKNLLACKTISQ